MNVHYNSDDVTLGELPTPTIAHVRSILDPTNYPSMVILSHIVVINLGLVVLVLCKP